MRQPHRFCFLLLSFLLMFAPSSRAADSLAVDESSTKAQLRDQSMFVVLAVENSTRQRIRAHVEVELLDPQGGSCGRAARDQDLPAGSSKVPFDVALPAIKPGDLPTVFWYRLAYRISSTERAAPVAPVSGIISISEIAPKMFELQVAYPMGAKPGAPIHVLVRAVQPATSRPVAGVRIQATLDAGDTDAAPPVRASATTNSHGYAAVDFKVPANADADRPEIKIIGQLGGYTASVETDQTYIIHYSKFLLSTDKPLYQPGQTLHARVLAFGPDHRAVADQLIELRILDPDETLVYKAEMKTSNFGIASADWTIPANQRLGPYRLQTDFGEDHSEDGGSSTIVKISRYDLPNFTVTAKADRAYYLPGQSAEVKVHADYLFGQPVTRGHVRIARENERTWNFHDQKWDIDEGKVYEGETDASGAFVAKIALADEQKDLADNDYIRFRDIRFTAYFTDPSSGRTEERRFDLRLTKDPIHVYVIESGRVEMKHTVDFYLSTFYADGTPVSCDVSIEKEESDSTGGAGRIAPVLRKIHTNRYGVAKVVDLPLGSGDDYEERTLVFLATDAQGGSGRHSESFWSYRTSGLRIATDKVFYKPDDPIEVRLDSDDREATVEVEATTELRFLSSQIVRLHHGRATLSFEPNDKFEGPVTVSAFELGLRPDRRYQVTEASGSHTVLFPHDTSLQLDVHLSKATYRPGEDAQADFHVNSPGGDAQKSALGLVVVDKAVEERQRTDQDLNAYSGFYGFLLDWQGDSNLSGIERSDLDKVDLSKPLPPGFALVAEILLQQPSFETMFDSSDAGPSLGTLFYKLIDPPLVPVIKALQMQAGLPKSPDGEAGIRRFLDGTPLSGLRDPWGNRYRTFIEPAGPNYAIKFQSAGPDKMFDTDDDFEVGSFNWPYFAEYDAKIQNAIEEYHARTGAYIRDAATLKSELQNKGLSLDSLRDPWGRAYRVDFGVERNFYLVEVRSAGPDGEFAAADAPSPDDVVVSRNLIDYFRETREKMDAALARYYQSTGNFPQSEKDLAAALRASGIDWESLRDPWANRYYATFRQEAQYSNAVVVQSYAEYHAGQRTTVRPVTSEINYIDIRSIGPDSKDGTPDDFDAARFSRATYAGSPASQTGANPAAIFSGELGAISGTVTDPAGGTIAGAKVIAKREGIEESYEAETAGDGSFIVRNVKPGAYEVHFRAAGFRETVLTDVPVNSSALTQVNARLDIGQTTETVTVESTVNLVQTETSSVVATKIGVTTKFSQGKGPVTSLSTPRLREYFPETLLWQPEVVTDSHGAAHLKFPLADSITTWKLAAVASTADGRIGMAEKEVRAFQPFFADQDLPQFLTAGDEIGLPVILRNFLDHGESVDLKLAPQPWLTLLGPAVQHAEVAANDSARAIFPMRAETPVKNGKQRVTATAESAADAIEKKTTVRPFGEERTASDSQILKASAALNISIPQNALPGSLEAELKVYPNLMAHLWEAIEAVLQRPYGCGEQTISSAYPSVLLLRYAKQAGREDSPQVTRARKYAQLGYDRLLSYQTEDGGFTYWGRSDSADVALTAYAVMFLHDAKQVMPVDDHVIGQAQSWLVHQMQPDGHWPAHDYWSKVENTPRSAMLTAYVARVLALTMPAQTNDPQEKQLAAQAQRELALALAWLAPRTEQQDEPYLIASYTLALLESGGTESGSSARRALTRLQSLSHAEGDTAYWSLETNTPFYGWGRAGRLETTALVLEVLELAASRKQEIDPSLVTKGTLFLLRNQDRYGIWYSTQATVNVLRALAAAVAPSASGISSGTRATVLVDGKPAATIDLPPTNQLSAPVAADLGKFLGSGDHRIEIHRAEGAPDASVQLAAQYYIPWGSGAASESVLHQKDSAEALRLVVTYDRKNAKVGEKINCAVKAERVDFRGYGMMLAEIGLPPGAEVDRDSLDKAMTDSNWEINQFDVLPDRVIVYLWPRAGGTTFSFAFATRFGINAETAPSVLYDYYNPDAQAIVTPTRVVAQ
jgi:A-macroglobulin complement component/alpha-2-macroglobulin family protein/MG2 domain-containing protein/carboxypeptidase family protein/A-macroglobulin receptor